MRRIWSLVAPERSSPPSSSTSPALGSATARDTGAGSRHGAAEDSSTV
jgi:hypothetical protein